MASNTALIQALCPDCGRIEVRSDDVMAFVDHVQGGQWCEYSCPFCVAEVKKHITPAELLFLVKRDVRIKGIYPEDNGLISAEEIFSFMQDLSSGRIMQRVLETSRNLSYVECGQ